MPYVCASRLLAIRWKRRGTLSSVSELIELFVWDSLSRKVTANIFFFIPILIEKIGEDGNEAEKLFHIVGPTDIDCTKNCNRYILKFELDSISRDSIVFLCEIASPINLFRTFKIISILREILFIFE